MSDLFGVSGRELLATAALAVESRSRVESLLRVIGALDFEIDLYTKLVAGRLRTDPGYRAIQQIPGIGPVLAAVFVAEIGDITRFHRPEQLASWAGLTPQTPRVRHHRAPRPDYETGLLGWCAGPRSRPCNACPGTPGSGSVRDRVGERRGRNIGVVAAARDLITLVFYGLRDHHLRCLPARARRREQPAGPRGGRGSWLVMIPEPARRDRPI